ncbi:sigma-70 family RNA polymerase sigma factor [Qipengyuania sp.]|uniref:sigma-70 family RNA polymerase sigma factor n=1 Tax=Qipengyuania sp. TaxID=2004515 RepID=UPI0035C7D6BF
MIHSRSPLAVSDAYGSSANDRVRRFTPLVHKQAWHLAASVEDFMEPEDLFQVGMIALIECSRRHDRPNEDGFAAYAKLRVRGAMVDAIRANRKGLRRRGEKDSSQPQVRLESIDEVYADSDGAFASEEPDALAQIIEVEDRDGLVVALRVLPERLQLVLQLYFVEELNLAEIAAVLEVSVPRVHQLKAAALKQLKATLTE